MDADCLESDKAAKEACKQLAVRLGAKEVEEKQAFRSLEGDFRLSSSIVISDQIQRLPAHIIPLRMIRSLSVVQQSHE